MAKDTDTILPDALEPVWDDEIAELFAKLTFREQTFCLAYLKHGVGARAYERTYLEASKEAAPALASRLIRSGRVAAFLAAFRENTVEDYFLVHRSLRRLVSGEVIRVDLDGQQIPIVPTVADVLRANSQLAKISGLNAPETVKVDATEELRGFMSKLKVAGP